mmetsp:Transcript_32291/g.75852  ORF Transcript_32291/g.75852 Transcript_32291/m.75852 type:complete len:83 (+) Transcript_32291:519-767(+)
MATSVTSKCSPWWLLRVLTKSCLSDTIAESAEQVPSRLPDPNSQGEAVMEEKLSKVSHDAMLAMCGIRQTMRNYRILWAWHD